MFYPAGSRGDRGRRSEIIPNHFANPRESRLCRHEIIISRLGQITPEQGLYFVTCIFPVLPISAEIVKFNTDCPALAGIQFNLKSDAAFRKIPGDLIRFGADFLNGSRLRVAPSYDESLSLVRTILYSQLGSVHLNLDRIR